MKPRIIHVISPYEGSSALQQRQSLFLESIDQANLEGVVRVAAVECCWSRAGWQTVSLARNAHTSLGDRTKKPFLKDLLAMGLSMADPHDWILFSNVDCAIVPDLYQTLRNVKGAAVEYMRYDVDGNPQSLDELFTFPKALYQKGIDAIALRAAFYQEAQRYLPDFIVGEPRWDNIYSALLHRAVFVHRDAKSLYHPDHEQAWQELPTTPAGEHNERLFAEVIAAGFVPEINITHNPEETRATNTAPGPLPKEALTKMLHSLSYAMTQTMTTRSDSKSLYGNQSTWDIFNPMTMVGSHFHFSWCSGIEGIANRSLIPTVYTNGLPALSIKSDQQSSSSLWVLAIHSSWQPFRIAGFSAVSFNIRWMDKSCADADIALSFEYVDEPLGEIAELQMSDAIPLQKTDLPGDKSYTIPLSTFFNSHELSSIKAKALVFETYDPVNLELSCVRLLGPRNRHCRKWGCVARSYGR